MAAVQVVSASFFFAVALFAECDAYGIGAPDSACVTMQPAHLDNGSSVAAQSSDSPYSIVLGSNNYTASGTVSVQIVGPVFRGFMIQARRPGMTTPVGSFAAGPTDTQQKTCTAAADTMTHTNTNDKENITLTWTAPSPVVGDVEFVATIAEVKLTFWMNVTSTEITGGSTVTKATAYVIVFCLAPTLYAMFP